MDGELNRTPWVVDGIVAQHAGEVLFGEPATRSIRWQCRNSYTQCLDDWLFAALYSDRIHVAKPGRVGRSTPGAELIAHFAEVVEMVDTEIQRKPEDLLSDTEARLEIAADIARMSDAINNNNRAKWREWIIRETQAFFGCDESLSKTMAPGTYAFPDKSPVLMFDSELASAIPESAVTLLRNEVDGYLNTRAERVNYTNAAARDFVVRNLITLVTISRWYDEDVASRSTRSVRLPSPVRSLIYQSERKLARKSSLIRNLLVCDAMEQAGRYGLMTPGKLIDFVLDQREELDFRKQRGYLLELSQLASPLSGECDRPIDGLRKAINEITLRRASTDFEINQAQLNSEQLISIDRPIRRINTYSDGNHSSSYVEAIRQICPELFDPRMGESYKARTLKDQDELRVAATLATELPFQLRTPARFDIDGIATVVEQIIQAFKFLIECRGYSRELDSEKAAQRLFFAVAYAYCGANNLDVTPEADTGNGRVDFKVSAGFTGRVLVEIKLSSSGKIVAGYCRQLKTYTTAEETLRGYYVVLNVGKMGNQYNVLLEMKNAASSRGEATSPIILVDGTRRPSASKL